SLKDTRTPMWLGIGAVALNAALSLTLIWQPAIREQAFGISTSTTTALSVILGLYLLRRRLGGRVGGRRLLASLGGTLAATVFAGLAAWLLLSPAETLGASAGGGFAQIFGGSHPMGWAQKAGVIIGRLTAVFLPLAAAVAVYFAAALACRMDEVRWLIGRTSAPASKPMPD